MPDNGTNAAMNLVLPDHGVVKQARIRVEAGFSDRELMAFSEQAQGYQVEWYGKERMLVMSRSGSRASALALALAVQVSAWARSTRNGTVYGADGGFRLPDGSVLAADVAWVSKAQLSAVPPSERDGFLPLCPELAIEVKSPSDTMSSLRKKCRRWLSAGAKAVLLVDGERRESELFLADGSQRADKDGTVKIPGFKGLVLNLAEAWNGDAARS